MSDISDKAREERQKAAEEVQEALKKLREAAGMPEDDEDS